MATEKSDSKADYICMEATINAFETLSRHYCERYGDDPVDVAQAKTARNRVLAWLCNFMGDHPYL